jgi:hypothetical protein
MQHNAKRVDQNQFGMNDRQGGRLLACGIELAWRVFPQRRNRKLMAPPCR